MQTFGIVNSKLFMLSKHFLRCFCTANGSVVSAQLALTQEYKKKTTFGLSQNLQQIIIRQEIKPREECTLGLQILVKRFLNFF